jgi:acetate kinase
MTFAIENNMKRYESHKILTVNSGSSSMKFALYDMGAAREDPVAEGAVERLGLPGARLWLRDGNGSRLADKHVDIDNHRKAVKTMFSIAMHEHRLPAPDGVGHRLVHGGPKHKSSEVITPDLLTILRHLVPMAPLHLPSELNGIDAVSSHYPDLQQVACFDTAFHRCMPELAQRLPLPRALWHEGIRRYGFHGLSYEYVVSALGEKARGRTIIAHLGNGASMAAVLDGQSCDTTMGFTATGGLMMGTRCGDMDPGVLFYLMHEKGYHATDLKKLLNNRSGLSAVSAISSDMQTLLEQRVQEPHAEQAIQMFCYIARKFIGALTATLGGLDCLVFTAGIGERGAPIRWEICRGLDYLGIQLDRRKNDTHAEVISSDHSRCTVRVVATNEDLMIARHTRRVLFFQTA